MRNSLSGSFSFYPSAHRLNLLVAAKIILLLNFCNSTALSTELAPPLAFPAGSAPRAIVTTDLNLDGLPDLVVAGATSSSVSLLINNGSRGFLEPQSLVVEGNPGALTTGDLNADGLPDIVVTIPTQNYVNIFFSSTEGTYSPATRHYTASYTTAVALGQFDSSPGLDLAVAHLEYGGIDILTNGGNGSFAWSRRLAGGGAPRALITSDLNADGHDDLAMVNDDVHSLLIYYGTGTGPFTGPATYPTPASPRDLAAADVNADGLGDVVIAAQAANLVGLYTGAAGGMIATRTDIPVGPTPVSIAFSDLDLDGVDDLIVGTAGDHSVAFLRGTGNATFAAPVRFDAGPSMGALVVADLDADGIPDLAATNPTEDAISVLFGGPDRPATSLSLASSRNPAQYGDSLTLVADVIPADASGTVQFWDGAQLLGSTAVQDGSAQLVCLGLTAGTHALHAYYSGSTTYASSSSQSLVQVVTPAPTTVSLRASANPSPWLIPVTISATLRFERSLPRLPAGTVTFDIDGGTQTATVPLHDSVATWTSSSLLEGRHTVVALFVPSDTLSFAPSTSDTLTLNISASGPAIAAVRDVPNDQGGRVFLTWRCPLDQPGVANISSYRIWRRIPGLAVPAVVGRVGLLPAHTFDPLDRTEDFWEAVAALPAAQLISYGYTAATTQDSIAGSNPWTAFLVQALTADPAVYYFSAVDSGYSVDNLAPLAPAQFAAQYSGAGTTLHWTASTSRDVARYRVYRDREIDFLPGQSNLLVDLTDTVYVDVSGTGQHCYKLAAVDIHGNEGRYRIVSPSLPTAALVTLVSAVAEGNRALIRWHVATDDQMKMIAYRGQRGAGWQALRELYADGGGYVLLEDAELAPGVDYGYRLGLSTDGGLESYAGEVWLHGDQSATAEALVIQNPSTNGVVSLSLRIPTGSVAPIELYDLSGRLVERQHAAGRAQRQVVRLGESVTLRSGIYLVRIGLSRPITRRVAIIQ